MEPRFSTQLARSHISESRRPLPLGHVTNHLWLSSFKKNPIFRASESSTIHPFKRDSCRPSQGARSTLVTSQHISQIRYDLEGNQLTQNSSRGLAGNSRHPPLRSCFDSIFGNMHFLVLGWRARVHVGRCLMRCDPVGKRFTEVGSS